MNGEVVLIEMQCELAKVRIRIAELELEIMRDHRGQRRAAANTRRQNLESAAALVSQLENVAVREAEEKARKPAAIDPAHTGIAARQIARGNVDNVPGRPDAPAGLSRGEPVQQPPAPTINVQETWPDGVNLEQPRTFGLKPPFADLDRNGASADEYHRRLTQHLAFATKVLHTSGVVAVVWREWRAFERLVQDRLRAVNAAPAVYTP